jgi:hypothetical protein
LRLVSHRLTSMATSLRCGKAFGHLVLGFSGQSPSEQCAERRAAAAAVRCCRRRCRAGCFRCRRQSITSRQVAWGIGARNSTSSVLLVIGFLIRLSTLCGCGDGKGRHGRSQHPGAHRTASTGPNDWVLKTEFSLLGNTPPSDDSQGILLFTVSELIKEPMIDILYRIAYRVAFVPALVCEGAAACVCQVDDGNDEKNGWAAKKLFVL